MSDDPYKEPENSTVDDWHGQKVDREMEKAEADDGGDGDGDGGEAS